jgi:hypothetical protein
LGGPHYRGVAAGGHRPFDGIARDNPYARER